jgi:16S rRNA (adenine1518-N6/adenine1519-N6)-dimethyltransferase
MHSKPKKSLGQNFLVDKNIQRKIIAGMELKPSDIILEIGAGRGELTQALAEKVKKVYAVEIDPNLCGVLKDDFEKYSNLRVINQDILKFDIRKHFDKIPGKIKIVGNIPYYISSPIIENLIEFRVKIDTVFITVQKEFAQRVTASCGSKDYGSFSCFVQYYTEPKILFHIKKSSFFPSPKVDSSFLKLKMRNKTPFVLRNKRLFFEIIRAAFNQRRKTLRNSLKGILDEEKLSLYFIKFGIDSNTRPEDLSLKDFANLANIQKMHNKT